MKFLEPSAVAIVRFWSFYFTKTSFSSRFLVSSISLLLLRIFFCILGLRRSKYLCFNLTSSSISLPSPFTSSAGVIASFKTVIEVISISIAPFSRSCSPVFPDGIYFARNFNDPFRSDGAGNGNRFFVVGERDGLYFAGHIPQVHEYQFSVIAADVNPADTRTSSPTLFFKSFIYVLCIFLFLIKVKDHELSYI